MGVSLSAPVGEKKRTTKPDPRKPNEKFKPVRNNPADVELVRLMLKANGYSIAIGTSVDSGLITAIKDFQKKKLGYKTPDGIVDPGGKTWNAGLPRLAAQIAADQKVELYKVIEGGKEKWVTKSEYEAGQEALRRQIASKALMMHGQTEAWVGFLNDIEKTRQAADGLLDALVEFTVSTVNDKTDPPWTAVLDARSATSSLKSVVSRKDPDWKKVYKQEQAATRAYNKGLNAFKKFVKERIETASSIVGKLEIVRDTSFAIVETYMTARLVATRGMSPAKAHAIAAASTEAMKSGAGQFGEYIAGNNVTWDGAAKKVFVDSFIAGLAGAAGGKLGDTLSKGMAAQLSKTVVPQLAGNIPTKVADSYFKRFLASKPGQDMVVGALKEVIGLMKPVIEKGRAPNMKEIREAVAKTLCAGIMGAATGRAAKTFTEKYAANTSAFLQKALAPSVMASIRGDLVKLYGTQTVDALIEKHGAEMIVKVGEQMSGKVVEGFMVDVFAASDGNQNARQMQKLAEDAMRRNKALRKRIEDMMKSEMANKAKKLEKA